MSNNIYDILKTMRDLSSPKTVLTEGKKAKPDFLDLNKNGNRDEPMKKAAKEKSKGAIAEAVARVEKNLAEKYTGFKKTAANKMAEGEDNESSAIDYEKVLEAIAALYGDDMWDNDAMGDLAQDLEQAGPTDRELDFIIAKGKLPTRLKGIRFTNTDDVQFGHLDEGEADQYEQDPYGQERKKIKPGNTVGSKIAAGAKNMKRKAEKFAANTMGHNLERGPLDEQNYTEDMLSPGQKKIAKMSPPPNKIDANDLTALRAGKNKKAEGNAFSGAVAKAKASGQDEFNVGGKEYAVKEGSPKKKTQSPDEQHKVVAGVRDAMRKGYDNVQKGRDERAAARFVAKLKYGSNDSEKTNEGWDEMMADVKQRSGPQPSGGSGIKAGKRYGGSAQKDEPETDNETGEVAKKGRGRPKKDKFAK